MKKIVLTSVRHFFSSCVVNGNNSKKMIIRFTKNSAFAIDNSFTSSRRGVVVLLRAPKLKIWSSKVFRNTVGIPQEEHPEFQVLGCSSKKSGSKLSVEW